MEEKGKNLATKEDIAEITDKIEKVKYEYNGEIEKLRSNLNRDFQEYMDNKKFMRERSYKQYAELYSKLYPVIIQSEYVRYFFNIDGDFSGIPFLEIHKKNKKSKINLSNMSCKHSETEITDPVTEFNKIKLAESIIEKGDLASEKLLKLAVAYRYVHQNYLINDLPPELSDRFKEEEVILISNIIKTVVTETNKLKKNCNLTYNEHELSNGIMSWEQ
jgi:hypothetical protein